MIIILRRRTLPLYFLLFFGLAILSGIVLSVKHIEVRPVFSANDHREVIYILDAGHGGEDGGAVSTAGIKESGINLQIAQKIDAVMIFLGEETLMTRKEDISIYSEGAESIRQKKASDLKNRVAIVQSTDHAVLVSIHQNSLPDSPRVHGAQVFYGAGEGSKELAGSVQQTLNKIINLENEKQEKRIDPSIYLMKNVDCPAILIECGFMSNPVESEKLQDLSYQKRIASGITGGILSMKFEESGEK